MDTKKNDIKIEGIGTITEGNYRRIGIEGVGKIRGAVQFEEMSVEGTCNTGGSVTGTKLSVSGLMKVEGDVRVRCLSVEGLLKTASNKVYADVITVEGMLKNAGEVNADQIMIRGRVNFNDLFGDHIEINQSQHVTHFFFGKKNIFSKKNQAHTIECDYLKACAMVCDTICATTIELSNHCVINTINCNGTLTYDATCIIHHIEGECTIQKK